MTEGSHDRDPAFGDELAAKAKKKPVLVAVDLGAESCRVSLLRWMDGQPEIRLVHRFANSARDEGNGLRWDMAAIEAGVEEACAPAPSLRPQGSLRLVWTVGLWTMCAWVRRADRSPTLFAIATSAPLNRKTWCTRGFLLTAFTN